MNPQFTLLRGVPKGEIETTQPPKYLDDASEAFGEVTQAVVLGEPGEGKTTTLFKIAGDLVAQARTDPDAALPVLARLRDWTDAKEPLAGFLASRLGATPEAFGEMLRAERLVLLLDGLNEVPVEQRKEKAKQLRELLRAHASARVLVSCRQLDYREDLALDLDTLTIRPLDPERIQAFLTAYLTLDVEREATDEATRRRTGAARAEDLFWKLAGGPEVKAVFEKWQRAGADLGIFFSALDVPRENPNVYSSTSFAEDALWREKVGDPRSLMRIAFNPLLLAMLVAVYEPKTGHLPANRAALFERFVSVLLAREKLATHGPGEEDIAITEDGQKLLVGLQALAWVMQTAGGEPGAEARLAITRSDASSIVAPPLLAKAAGARLLDAGDPIHFTHQLLQEYFAACALREKVAHGKLLAEELWPPDRWWQPSGWEESAVLLAGLHGEDCTAVVEWLAEANPEAAARCVARSGAHISPDTLRTLRARWTPRLTDLVRDSRPEARAAVGRALGMLYLDGLPLDSRRGVSVARDSQTSALLPDIDWVDVPEGEFKYGDPSKPMALYAFRIARYPITNAQFQCFIDDHGYETGEWWEGLERVAPERPRWNYANHPRETVSWYEATAFCRWLDAKLRAKGELPEEWQVRLPIEQEWEKAARGTDGREYPWPGPFQDGLANIWETESRLEQTSAVGIYPRGASPCGALDMAGNVWEWCASQYDAKERSKNARRVLRGGSWSHYRGNARCAARYLSRPVNRGSSLGFRVVCVSPIR